MSEQHWIEVTATVAAADETTALTRLAAAGLDQCWIVYPLVNRRGDDGWDTRRGPTAVVHLALDPLEASQQLAAARAALADLSSDLAVGELAAADWLRLWREGRRIVPLCDGWCISPPWLAESAPDPARAILIDPGLAFGAGDHPTTRDSAIVLLELLRPGDRILDLGAGSGVLSILARRAGAGEAVAVELDDLAAAEIPRNAALNATDGIEAIAGDALSVPLVGVFDLLLCNIGARLARALAPRLDAVAAPGGRIVLSGLTEWTAGETAAAYAELGWTCRRRLQAGSEWVTLGLESDRPRSASRADSRES